ncbi:hypothetical protein J2S06_003237 [Bacillus alveayuensis]|uniref:Fur-regulated basic protein B n=1 Tax=Aeribacillus alveayuensis TaxID=279215 RepID=A0ABT9VSX6_9BACI|nr:hypothetical protein [Bacillus alveayuensis]
MNIHDLQSTILLKTQVIDHLKNKNRLLENEIEYLKKELESEKKD